MFPQPTSAAKTHSRKNRERKNFFLSSTTSSTIYRKSFFLLSRLLLSTTVGGKHLSFPFFYIFTRPPDFLKGRKDSLFSFLLHSFFLRGPNFFLSVVKKKAPPRKIRQKGREKMDIWRINRPTTFQAINLSNCQTYSKTNSRGG